MRLAITVITGVLLATAGSSLRAQTKPAATPAKPAASAAQSPAAKPAQAVPAASKPAPAATAKPAAKPAAKAASKGATKKSSVRKKEAPAAASSGAPKPPAESETKTSRRDPFESLTSRQEAAARAGANLPPGKAGLQVATLRLDGIVRAPNGMIAVVTNPQARTYFLREGDQLYDGRVEKIAMDGVSFHEMGKDAFGKPVERQVNKRIYSSAGEQQ
jgi:Tfp pilus assembly protein PilP